MHQVSFLFADRGTPDGFRHMNGYGSHTFKMLNAKGEAVFVKFHAKVISYISAVLTVQNVIPYATYIFGAGTVAITLLR